MNEELERELQDAEASWPKTKELAFAIDDPLEKLMEKAKQIFKGKHWDNLDALAVRIAQVCPAGVTDENFEASEPVAGAAKKYFGNIEKLRTGLNRPFLDAKKAVDEAAKATVSRAEPTLNPIIKKVKEIQDRRKREEEVKAEAERKRIEDERLAAEKARRDAIEAEHAAEKKRLADQAEANRKEAAAMAAQAKAANDELAELKRQLAKAKEVATPTPESPAIMPRKSAAEIESEGRELAEESAKMCGMDDHGYPILPKDERADWPPTLLPSLDNDAPPLPSESAPLSDQQKVREYGDAIAAFKDRVGKPICATEAAQQVVGLAFFDLCELASSLQKWSAP